MLTERFLDALAFACRLHATQVRKGSGTPYVAHLLAVSATVLEHGGDETQAIAALLHDAVEDQGGLETRDLIAERFGDEVAELVMGCTDSHSEPKPPWRSRKEAYVSHLYETTPAVRLVAAADKLHNARAMVTDYRSIGEDLWSRFTADRSSILWYYQAIRDAFLQCGPNALAREIAATIQELERLIAEENA